MKYEAIENFSGIISMTKGQVREIPNESLAKDLMKAGLIQKYVANDNSSLKEELNKANETINSLQEENSLLKDENASLKEQLAEKNASGDNEPPAEGEGNAPKDDETSLDKDSTGNPKNQETPKKK